MNGDDTKWKAAQRDWLVKRLVALGDKWLSEEASESDVFSPDPDTDKIAKSRTGGCARELGKLLSEMD